MLALVAILLDISEAAVIRMNRTRYRLHAARAHSVEPTPDETGLFGPSFDVPLKRIETGDTVAQVQMRLAITPPEQHHGLMFRTALADSEGMLFLYQEPSRRVLWMKNTLIPLEAAWFTRDGMLQEVQHLYSNDLTYRWSGRADITFGLEVSEGFFEQHQLSDMVAKGGLRLNMQALSSAINSRGFNSALYLND